MARKSKQVPRWHVEADYAKGVRSTTDIEELDELHDFIEGNFDWTFLEKITITLNGVSPTKSEGET